MKQKTFCGIDFGTTNSSIAIVNEKGQTKVLSIDPFLETPTIMRSVIYVSPDKKFLFGTEAINAYLHDIATCPPSTLKLIWTGKYIRVPKPTGISGFSGDKMVKEIICVEDTKAGRLLQSLKNVLSAENLSVLDIFGEKTTIGDLLGLFLREMKLRGEKILQQKIDNVVLGRPVHFVGKNDKKAQERLKSAAKMAGFKKVVFEYEPVGAAWNYGSRVFNKKQTVLIFDFGGGTLDFSVLEFPEKKILANHGLPIGGDLFNSYIFENKLARYFGKGETYGLNKNPFPLDTYSSLKRWYSISQLKTKQFLDSLEDMRFQCSNIKTLDALRSLVFDNLGFALYDKVDQVKKTLSVKTEGKIVFREKSVDIDEEISRVELEKIIAAELEKIDEGLDLVLKMADKKTNEINFVITTGGSSLIPVIQKMLCDKFGANKIKSQDTFTGVVTGLALRAKEIFG